MQFLLKLRPKNNIRTYTLTLFLIAAAIYMKYKIITAKRYIIIHWDPMTFNISCHYSREGDALKSAEGMDFAPAPRSIFFHETSCRGGLNSRQACAVESAARAHPSRQVHLLFSAPVTEHVLNNSCIAKLLEFQNVKVARVHIVEYSKDTRINSFISKYLNDSKWNHTEYPVEYTADVLRYVTLNKWGGIYLDLDMLLTRSLESLPPNWIVRLSKTDIATGILAFARDDLGSDITGAILEKMSTANDPFNLFINGTRAIFEAISKKCPGVLYVPEVDDCDGLAIYKYKKFYPVDSLYWFVYYNARDLPDLDVPYTHHMWNNLGQDSRVHRESPYAQLAKKYCPDIYEIYGDEFGV